MDVDLIKLSQNHEGPRVVVAQMGARHSYAYPLLLEKHGLLSALITDYCEVPDAGFVRRLFASFAGNPRRLVNLPKKKVRSFPILNVMGLAKRFIDNEALYDLQDQILGYLAESHTIHADVLLSTFGNGGGLIEKMRTQGAAIVTDLIIAADHLEVVREEQLRWQDWEPETVSLHRVEAMREKIERLLFLSDVLICPSIRVQKSIEGYTNFQPGKVRVLDYPTPSWTSRSVKKRQNERLRVLFVGTPCLRKGVHIYALACKKLRDEGLDYEFLVAGQDLYSLSSREDCAALTFLGQLTREQLAEQLSQADIFCLPSLCEGSPTAILEALAFGIPVITTEASGSRVRNGHEGLIIPERDPDRLAQAIKTLGRDAELRQSLSFNARVLSEQISGDAWEKQFLSIINLVRLRS
jgi:glycosyltransferase involved in cell wall biosynthesis